MERIGRHFGSGVIGDACFAQPSDGALAGVNLNGQGDEGEEGDHGIEGYTDEQEHLSRTGTDEEKSAEYDPRNPIAAERDDGHECRAHLERSVSLRMLNGMSALMCCYSRRRDISAMIDFVGEVDGFVSRVIMVGQLAFDTRDLYIIDTMVMEHFLCDLASGETEGLLGIALELTLERSGDDPAGECDTDKNDPI